MQNAVKWSGAPRLKFIQWGALTAFFY